ncbi:MAG: YfhO family protein, partial [Cytophagales bacterium]
ASLGILMLGDLWLVDKRYLNEENFQSERKFENLKIPTTADLQIMEDDDLSYRVFNLTRSPFNDGITSYHHKSIGGYHAGKLYRYQELIERHLSKNNMKVLNMLNTKYFIVADKNTNQPQVRRNPGALGNAWFVNSIKWVSNADEEMNSLSSFDPANEVVIDERFKPYFESKSVSRDSLDEIELKEYSPNVMVYNANVYSNNAFAVFSEIYYKASDNDWKVTIDGESVDHIRVNYLLRGLLIPKGEHEIVFTFQPKSWKVGNQISLFSSIVLVIFIGGAVFFHFRKRSNENNSNGES